MSPNSKPSETRPSSSQYTIEHCCGGVNTPYTGGGLNSQTQKRLPRFRLYHQTRGSTSHYVTTISFHIFASSPFILSFAII